MARKIWLLVILSATIIMSMASGAQDIAFGVDFSTDLNISMPDSSSNKPLTARTSNGNDAELNVLPLQAALHIMSQLNTTCGKGNCTVKLTEIEEENGTRIVYAVHTIKDVKIVGVIDARMRLVSIVDAQTGEVLEVRKPWWAFFSSTVSITGNAISNFIGASPATNQSAVPSVNIIQEGNASSSSQVVYTNKTYRPIPRNGGGGGSSQSQDDNVADTSAPYVESTSPYNGENNVIYSRNISVVFNEAMRESTINSSTFILYRGDLQVNGTVMAEGNSAIFDPYEECDCNATYTVVVTSDVEDLSGNNMGSNYTFIFSTNDTDRSPPITTDNAPSDWVNRSIEVNLTANDESAVAQTLYCIDRDDLCVPNEEGNRLTVEEEGVSYIRYHSVDSSGNVENITSKKVMVDMTTPHFLFNSSRDIPLNITKETLSFVGDIVTFNMEGNDSLSGRFEADCSPQSGSFFARGSTKVNCIAIDNAGNSAYASFDVIVKFALGTE